MSGAQPFGDPSDTVWQDKCSLSSSTILLSSWGARHSDHPVSLCMTCLDSSSRNLVQGETRQTGRVNAPMWALVAPAEHPCTRQFCHCVLLVLNWKAVGTCPPLLRPTASAHTQATGLNACQQQLKLDSPCSSSQRLAHGCCSAQHQALTQPTASARVLLCLQDMKDCCYPRLCCRSGCGLCTSHACVISR